MGAALKARQAVEVVGIEIDPVYVERARGALDRVLVADLDVPRAALPDPVDLGRFDCLIAGDVLEHLRDPWDCLDWAVAMLDPGATVVVSLPNIRYWETFWQVGIKGVWPRRSVGIFDRTHLRWFTASNAIELLEGAHLEVVTVDRLYRFRPQETRWDRYARLLERTPLRPFFAFQLVLVGRRPR